MTEQQIEKQITKLRKELIAIRERKDGEKNAKLYKRCFKYRNCFSCPQDPTDYWWMYCRVVAVKGSTLTIVSCQKDKYGTITFETKERMGPLDNYTEIKEDEFAAAYDQLLYEARAAKP